SAASGTAPGERWIVAGSGPAGWGRIGGDGPRGLRFATDGRLPAMPATTSGATVRPTDVEHWLDELGLSPADRADRDGISSWDLRLDGVRRFDVPITLILDPAF